MHSAFTTDLELLLLTRKPVNIIEGDLEGDLEVLRHRKSI
jgi:hypothetical protein